jgi:UDP-3-O-[3-hydroxymyristoyl] glucosamine N-acyltransferase
MKFSAILKALSLDTPNSLQANPTIDPELHTIDAVNSAPPGSLSYIEGGKFTAQVDTTQASALILPHSETLQAKAAARNIAWVSVTDPRLVFAQAIALFYKPFRPAPGIHPTAIIDPSVKVGAEVSIGAHVVIQAGVQLGNQVCIHPNVVIYPDVMINDRTLLHANCVIHERTQIGADCVIHSGAAIGAEGFGFVPTAQGWVKMEQSGYVVLEDKVEIGCNSAVDRPAVGETRIGRDTKIDNLVQIAHNCQIGESCAFAAQVGLAGGVKTGKGVILGGQAGVANLADIGDRVQAGARAGIHSSVEAGSIVMGTPALPYKTFLKVSATQPRLPEMYRSLQQMQQQLEALQQQIQALESP